MGWAKYLEDNISIYNNNLYMRSCKTEDKPMVVVKINTPVVGVKPVTNALPKTVITKVIKRTSIEKNGRRGIAITFGLEKDLSLVRKLQMNGWWWSNNDCCWYNTNTKANRRFANHISIEFNASICML